MMCMGIDEPFTYCMYVLYVCTTVLNLKPSIHRINVRPPYLTERLVVGET
jgi:hypothetical protein